MLYNYVIFDIILMSTYLSASTLTTLYGSEVFYYGSNTRIQRN